MICKAPRQYAIRVVQKSRLKHMPGEALLTMKKGGINMKDLNVLLVCGSGASSGFMAANMRKAANIRKLSIKITARSEVELENYIDEIDAVMVGPHLKYAVDDITEKVKGTGTKVILMKPEYYSTLNGGKALDHLLSYFE